LEEEMTRFDEVARLHEQQNIPEFRQRWEVHPDGRKFADGTPCADIKIPGSGKVIIAYTLPIDVAGAIVDIRNAAPWLLGVVGCFQPGDAHILKGVLRYLTEDFENSEHSNAMVVFLLEEPDMRMRMVDVLVRALKAAEIMEGKE
jgi:hypothetical protein